jgi:hypothetical protein
VKKETNDEETIQVKSIAGAATVLESDIVGPLGVIHVIDTVI